MSEITSQKEEDSLRSKTEEPVVSTPTIEPTITTKKQKKPGRVAAGKRLAELSRKRREAKKYESESNASSSWFESYSLIIGVAGLVIAGVSLMYARKSVEVSTPPKEPEKVESNVTIKKTETPRNRLETLD